MSKEMTVEQKRYTTSGRHEGRKHNPLFSICAKCKGNMFSVRADTTKDRQHIYFKIPMKYCPSCKLVKLLSGDIKLEY